MPVRDSGPRTRLALPDERPVIAIASRGCARKLAQDAQGDIRYWRLPFIGTERGPAAQSKSVRPADVQSGAAANLRPRFSHQLALRE